MPDTFTLNIDLGNDAMQTAEDIDEALRSIAAKVLRGKLSGSIVDANGNTVGRWEFS